MLFTRRFVFQSTFLFLVVGFVALIGIVGMTFWLGERTQVNFDEVIAARTIRSAAIELRSAIQTGESSQRGFLLTGNEIYLAPYNTAKAQATRQMANLRQSLMDDRRSDVIVERLAAIISEKFDEMDRTIDLKRDRRDTEALDIVRTKRGKALTDQANVFFSGVVRDADDRLTAGVEEERTNAAWLRTVTIVGGIVIVLVVGGAIFSILRYTRDLRRARDEVRELNADLEERVRVRTADLAQANDEIQRFAYIVTHDLRAPLVNIMGFTAELESGVKSAQALVAGIKDGGALPETLVEEARVAAEQDLPEAIGFIRSSTRKMDGLINAILKLVREGRRVLRPEPIVLADVVKASAAALQHQVAEADGEVHFDLDVPPLVNDRLSLDQIFGNLLDNAVKYRDRTRPLRIEVRAQLEANGNVSVAVADNGRGISDQDRERVFELFRRAGTLDQPGEGIGLAHVRTLVRNLGGQISMTSVLGQGTTFVIVLPRNIGNRESIAA